MRTAARPLQFSGGRGTTQLVRGEVEVYVWESEVEEVVGNDVGGDYWLRGKRGATANGALGVEADEERVADADELSRDARGAALHVGDGVGGVPESGGEREEREVRFLDVAEGVDVVLPLGVPTEDVLHERDDAFAVVRGCDGG